MRACSACAGDYEDPERTAPAGATESGGEEDVGAESDEADAACGDEFAAERMTGREGGDNDAENQSKDGAR